jgi:hypothetical protein
MIWLSLSHPLGAQSHLYSSRAKLAALLLGLPGYLQFTGLKAEEDRLRNLLRMGTPHQRVD